MLTIVTTRPGWGIFWALNWEQTLEFSLKSESVFNMEQPGQGEIVYSGFKKGPLLK
jgi:hypothetical protein